jgi:hypothetical protein
LLPLSLAFLHLHDLLHHGHLLFEGFLVCQTLQVILAHNLLLDDLFSLKVLLPLGVLEVLPKALHDHKTVRGHLLEALDTFLYGDLLEPD